LTPERAAQVEDMTLDRHVVQMLCCREAERAGQSWDGKCAKHQGTAAQRAEHRRWQAKAAAVTLAQTLGRTTDHVRVVNYDQAAQEDSHFGPAPVVDRVYFVP
jgi:hypothetical protein